MSALQIPKKNCSANQVWHIWQRFILLCFFPPLFLSIKDFASTMLMNAISSKYPGFLLTNPRLFPEREKALRHKRKNTSCMFFTYRFMHMQWIALTLLSFRGLRKKQLGCQWHCCESQVPLTPTHPASARSLRIRRCCSKRPVERETEREKLEETHLNRNSDRLSGSYKTQSCNQKREETTPHPPPPKKRNRL